MSKVYFLLLLGLLSSCLDPTIRLKPASQPSVQTSPQVEIVYEPFDTRRVELTAVADWIVEYTNQARIAEGLPALTSESRLAEVAQAHSQNMAEQNFFSHIDLQGKNHQNRLDQRYPGLVHSSGENIAKYPVIRGSDQDLARRLVDGWLASAGHRENIMRTSYTRLGIGLAQQDNYVYATQLFAASLTY